MKGMRSWGYEAIHIKRTEQENVSNYYLVDKERNIYDFWAFVFEIEG